MGKLSLDLIFSQLQKVEVKLDKVQITMNDRFDEAYNHNFNIITFQKTFESTKSKTKLSKADRDKSCSTVSWIDNSSENPH